MYIVDALFWRETAVSLAIGIILGENSLIQKFRD